MGWISIRENRKSSLPGQTNPSEGVQLFLGDLNHEWAESVAIARTKPNLKAMENSVNTWFAKNGGAESR
jgi:hypothetical protein